MTNTLTWLKQTAGSSKGGFFSTHPGSDDRIQKIQEVAMDPVHMPPIS
jgi:Zn-dependent protease with chaperone function